MKKLSLTLLGYMFIFNFLHGTNPHEFIPLIATLSSNVTPQTIALTSTSRTILHLFYITQHLDPALVFITKTVTASKKIDTLCALQIISFFSKKSILKSEKIKKIFTEITQKKSIIPLLALWDPIKQFKYGMNPDDKNILLDFSKLCLITYQSLLTTLNHKSSSPVLFITPEDLDSIEQIDQIFETMEKYSLFYLLRKSSESQGEKLHLLESHSFLSNTSYQQPYINDFCASFALRFYLNKRLENSFALLTTFHNKKTPLFTHGIESLGFKKDDIVFDNQVIAGYFALLQKEQSLHSLMKLIGQFQSFDFIKSPTFIKEFLILLCIVYKDLTMLSLRSTEMITELDELSLEQLLSLIDTLNEKYHKKSFSVRKKEYPEASINTLIENEYGISPDTFTHMVFHRYYYIKRLGEVVKTLLKLTTTPHKNSFFKTSLPLKPLAMVWEDFVAYKEICDQHLIDTFTKEIFILSQTVLHHPVHQHAAHILEAFLSKKESESSVLMHDFKPAIEVDKVILRFYIIKRLEPIITKMHMLDTKGLLHLTCTQKLSEKEPLMLNLTLQKEPILTMIQTIYKEHSFKPLFTFWRGINNYKYIQDDEICKEFARFITHLIYTTTTSGTGLYLENKGFLPLDQLNEMPLEDILNLLDLLVEELPAFLKQNELDSTMQWKEWGKKYWLIAPISAVVFSIRIYMMYKGVLEKPAHSASV